GSPSWRSEEFLLVCLLITSYQRNNQCVAERAAVVGEELSRTAHERQQNTRVSPSLEGFGPKRIGAMLKNDVGTSETFETETTSKKRGKEWRKKSRKKKTTIKTIKKPWRLRTTLGYLPASKTSPQQSRESETTSNYLPTAETTPVPLPVTDTSLELSTISELPSKSRTWPPSLPATGTSKTTKTETTTRSKSKSKSKSKTTRTLPHQSSTTETSTARGELSESQETTIETGTDDGGAKIISLKKDRDTKHEEKSANYAAAILLICGILLISQLGVLTYILAKFLVSVKTKEKRERQKKFRSAETPYPTSAKQKH
ncbi:hypothetical protein V3C99_013912, partial [Haemonchus contortus]